MPSVCRLSALLGLVLIISASSVVAATPAEAVPVRADFSGDSRSDLAVGAPWDLSTDFRAGVVFARDFRTGQRDQLQIGNGDYRRGGSELGQQIASCDLNGDRYADLVATTDFGERTDGQRDYGVQIFLGSSSGLQVAGRLTEHAVDPPPVWALACGDLNGDGYDEVAVGDPNLRVGGKAEAGGVRVYRGGRGGPTTTGRFTLTQEYPGLPGGSERGDFFGASLAFGDLDGDRYDDLIVGAPYERPYPVPTDWDRSGAVAVLYGSRTGPSTTRSVYLGGDHWKLPGQFGWSVTAADLSGDGKDDLIVGAPQHRRSGNSIGGVGIFTVTRGALTLSQLITQADTGVIGASGPENRFGHVLAAGDITGDHQADLVVGAPGQQVGGQVRAGSITVLPGTAAGVDRGRSQFVTLASAGVAGTATAGDGWPWAMTVLDTSGDGRAEVYASLRADRRQSLYQFPGSGRGAVTTKSVRLTQSDLQSRPTTGVGFGSSLG